MKKFAIPAFTLVLASGHALAQDCTAPAKPTLPDGGAASMEQMLEGQKAVKAYQAENIAYRECLEPGMEKARGLAEQGEDGAEDATEEYMALQEAYNASVTAEEEVAGQFNTEVREYKAANPQ